DAQIKLSLRLKRRRSLDADSIRADIQDFIQIGRFWRRKVQTGIRRNVNALARAASPVADDRRTFGARCRWIRPNGFQPALLPHHSTNILPHPTKFTDQKWAEVASLAVPSYQVKPAQP